MDAAMTALQSTKTTLQPILQPVTHNLPQFIRDFGESLLGKQCYSSLVLDIDILDFDCDKLAISKILGIAIVSAASFVKVPQIINLVRSKSADGISLVSYLLESTGYLISLVYNVRNSFPFSTYGETLFILAQNAVIMVLVLNYSGKQGAAALLMAVLAASVAALFSDALVDMGTLGYLQAGAGTLGVLSKVPQIAAIYSEGSTGQLSAYTVSSAFCFSRSSPRCPPVCPPLTFSCNLSMPFSHATFPSYRELDGPVRHAAAPVMVSQRKISCTRTQAASHLDVQNAILISAFGRSSTISPAPSSEFSRLSRRWTTS